MPLMGRGTDPASRAGQAAFAAASATGLYTAAAFGALLFSGVKASEACLLAAGGGVLVAYLAGRLVQRNELREKRRKILLAQLESMQAKAAGPLEPEVPAAERLSEAGRETRQSREIQAALLPGAPPGLPGYHLEASYDPCGALGGDFYDFRLMPDGRFLITMGDVSGKGPAGAIVMAMVQTLFRQNSERALGPRDLLIRVNDGFAGTLGKGVFVTTLAALLDPERHTLTLAGAGHHPVLLLNPRERRSTLVAARGAALGVVGGQRFAESLVETVIDLGVGESLLLYTDGATDGLDGLTTGTGEHRFRAAAAAAVLPGPRGALARLKADLWQGGGRRDDTTLVLVARVGGANPSGKGAGLSLSRTETDLRV